MNDPSRDGVVSSQGLRAGKLAAAPRRRRSNVRLRAFNDPLVPTYMRFNPWVKQGYRVGYTWRQALRSLYRPDNETGNIYSHLLGEPPPFPPMGHCVSPVCRMRVGEWVVGRRMGWSRSRGRVGGCAEGRGSSLCAPRAPGRPRHAWLLLCARRRPELSARMPARPFG